MFNEEKVCDKTNWKDTSILKIIMLLNLSYQKNYGKLPSSKEKESKKLYEKSNIYFLTKIKMCLKT